MVFGYSCRTKYNIFKKLTLAQKLLFEKFVKNIILDALYY